MYRREFHISKTTTTTMCGKRSEKRIDRTRALAFYQDHPEAQRWCPICQLIADELIALRESAVASDKP